MRGADQQPDALFSYVSPEQRVPRGESLFKASVAISRIGRRGGTGTEK